MVSELRVIGASRALLEVSSHTCSTRHTSHTETQARQCGLDHHRLMSTTMTQYNRRTHESHRMLHGREQSAVHGFAYHPEIAVEPANTPLGAFKAEANALLLRLIEVHCVFAGDH